MSENPVSDDMMIAYLMGDLAAEEESRLEEQFFVADGVFEQLLAIEDELIDDYVRGDLSARQRIRFEQHFLNSPERRRKLAFARSLEANRSPSVPAPARPRSASPATFGRGKGFLGLGDAMGRWALAGAAAVLLLGGSLLLSENGRLRNELRLAQGDRETMREQEEALRQRLDAVRTDGPQALADGRRHRFDPSEKQGLPSVSLTLISGLVRSGGEQRMLAIPPGPHIVQLQVPFEPDSYQAVRATIETAEGKTVWSQEIASTPSRSEHPTLSLVLSSDVLGSDDYVLTLNGVHGDGAVKQIDAFSFRVARH